MSYGNKKNEQHIYNMCGYRLVDKYIHTYIELKGEI